MISWDIWNQGLQNRLNEIGSGQYDWSFVTPEVVKGFTRYQALRPETEVKEADEFEKALEESEKYTNDELIDYLRRRELKKKQDAEKERVYRPDTMIGGTVKPATWQQFKDTDMGDWIKGNNTRRSDEELMKEVEQELIEKGIIEDPNSPKDPRFDIDARNIVNRAVERGGKFGSSRGGVTVFDEDQEAELRQGLLKERLGDRYDALKRSYDIYGSLNPYEQMIQAGKRSSYWDPEIGKIYTDAGEKIRNDRIAAWKEALEGETMLQNRAMDMYKQTGLSRYRREAEKRLQRITNILQNNPRKDGQWFEGYDTDAVTDPNVASAYGKLEKMILDEGPMEKETLLTLMAENGIKGEDATDLLKQNDAEWAKRYGPAAEATKRTEEAIRAQSETFKKDQTERVKNMNLLDDLREKLASKNAREADYRMAAETLRKLNLDVSKSFDEERKKLIETAKTNMVNNPSFKTIGAFLVLTVGDKLGLLPEDLNSITSNEDWKKLVRDGIETLYDTDANMYEVERENMEGYLKGVPGIDTSRLSWMQSRKSLIPNDVGIGAVSDKEGNFTVTLPNGVTDSWTVDMKEEHPEFFKFFKGERSRVRLKKGTTNILTDGRWEYDMNTKNLVEV